jgi:hypothetical protein
MLAPHVAEDVDVFQRHISRPAGGEGSDPYQTLSHDARNPIIYLTVPRYRTGLRPEIGAGKEQLEILEQILGPFKQEVIELYFNHVYYHFPVLDDETCSSLRRGPTDSIPKNLMCVIYAIGSPNWRKSDTLKMHARPDSYFVWNKAISAVIEDFLSPSMSTVSAAVLDQIGRPSVSIVGNITLCGRTVSLAQIFGLHRDPSKWDITQNEKMTRTRIWWGVLITDYWSSIAYGAPPHIAKGFYDVPMPTLDSLLSSKATMRQKYASTCFLHLCALTELLGSILPLVYHIGPDPQELSLEVQRLKLVLNDLESQLPEWMPLPDRTGSSNLWFCFLSMRLLLSRVALRAAVLVGDRNLEMTRLDELRESSSAVLDLILYLGESQFQDFWFPYATHLLVQAVTVSLRCAVETKDREIRNASTSRLERFLAHIQHAYDNYDWDIALYCLERCSDSVKALTAREAELQPALDAVVSEPSISGDSQLNMTAFDDTSLLSDIFDPNAFDFSWEALWDTPAAMTNFSV